MNPLRAPSMNGAGTRWLAELDAGAWYVLVAVCLLFPLSLDRSGMIDNDNYVDYFVNGQTLAWTWLFTDADSWVQFIFRLSTEEILWLAWTTAVGQVAPPQAAVYITAFLLNVIVVLALRCSPNRSVALALWLVIPFGFAVIGTYQIRQGLAFAVWLYLGVRRERLVLGSLAAALIHTTFSVVAVLALLAAWRRCGNTRRLAAVCVAALLLAFVGDVLFAAYGGRRVSESGVLDPDTLSVNFLLGLLIVLAYPAYLAVASRAAFCKPGGADSAIEDYLILYVGIVTFLIASFFMFPVGNLRLPYIAWLGLIPLVGHFDVRSALADARAARRGLIGFGLVFAFLFYQVLGAAAANQYLCLLVPHCADALVR
jgi:hypothetical protein